jgi:RNA polymerase sigma-70 factor, ECF subfamily
MTERRLSVPISQTIADPVTAAPATARPGVARDASLDEVAQAATAGDVEAVGRLYDELVGPIYRYIAVRVRRREDAEDLTHLVFERIVAALPRYHHNGRPFAAWAFRIARNAVIDHQRRVRPTEPLETMVEPVDGAGIEAMSLRREELVELQQAIARLTPDQREALLLRYAGGLSADEAAEVMGRRAGTIRGLTFRAIEALRRQLGGGGDR